jgi:hypothetical protein
MALAAGRDMVQLLLKFVGLTNSGRAAAAGFDTSAENF